MIFRFLVLFVAVISFGANIKTAKVKLKQNKFYISRMNEKLDILARQIALKQTFLQNLNKKISSLNHQINSLNKKLINSNKKFSNLNDLKKGYEIKSENIQTQITNFISENYFNTLLKPENINDLVNKEITDKILQKYSKKIKFLIKENKKITNQINSINKQINNIKSEQNQLLQKKQQLAALLRQQKKQLQQLSYEKNIYRKKLKKLLNEQKFLQNELAKLKIIQKKRKFPKIPPPNYKPSLINVRKVGSIYYRPKLAYYRGAKTIPPVRGKIIKKFGPYTDPVYHLKFFNSSITIKPYKPNSVVRAILNGRVIYIVNNDNKKIIIIKHKNDLFSIYANLSKISPILKKGFYVKKGQIIARVKNTLVFEITYKENPINPLEVINLR